MNHLTKIIINRLTVDDDDDVDSFLDERLILVTVWDVNINVVLVGFKWFFFVVPSGYITMEKLQTSLQSLRSLKLHKSHLNNLDG